MDRVEIDAYARRARSTTHTSSKVQNNDPLDYCQKILGEKHSVLRVALIPHLTVTQLCRYDVTLNPSLTLTSVLYEVSRFST